MARFLSLGWSILPRYLGRGDKTFKKRNIFAGVLAELVESRRGMLSVVACPS
ncbi:hypothetical protein [Marimonas lutisalis]|uniref:hypothetical protein n=1 Tax=Marimonas lutisalis TaxID=2545756 RepID=UPI00137593AA|nr:hypothetical protein [Marimonas lutisalis]